MKTDMKIIHIPDFLVVLKSLEKEASRTVSEIQYDTRITYSHIFYTKKVLLEKGWIQMKLEGLKHKLMLTERGKDIVQATNVLLDKMGVTHDDLAEYRRQTKTKKTRDIVQQEQVEQHEQSNEGVEDV